MLEHLSVLIEHFSYLGILVLLSLGGLGLPVPEELVQIAAGALAARGYLHLPFAMVACYAGVLTGDILIFRLGYRLGPKALENKRLKKLFTPRRVAFISRHYEKHGVLTVIVARHMSLMRAPTFLFAGVSRMKPWHFIAADAFSALLSVPIVTLLAFKFANRLPELLHGVHTANRVILAVVGAGAVVAYVVWHFRKRKERGAPDEVMSAEELLKMKREARS